MDGLKKYALPLLALVLLAGLAVGFRSFFLRNLIEPVAFLFWAAWRIVASVNQNIYWMVLLVICAILLLRLVPAGEDGAPRPAYNYRYESPNRVEYWQRLIEDARLGKDEMEQLRDSLKKLSKSVSAQGSQPEPSALEEIWETGNSPWSSRARRFLFPSKEQVGLLSIGRGFGFPSFIPRRLRRWAGKFIPQDTAPMDEILEWMENEMEISHE